MSTRTADEQCEVLVVDDHHRARESMADILRCAGHKVRCSASGVEALKQLESGPCDVVVTDLVEDARLVKPGDIFLARPGRVADGREFIKQAQAAGELPADEDCSNLATFISDAWQGVLARLKVGRNLQPLEAFITRLERLLQA